MTDLNLFEARFARAYQRYLVNSPTQVDAVAVAHAVTAQRRQRLAGWTWPRIPGRAAVWAAVALLLALALGALLVGSASRPTPTATPAPTPAPTYPVVMGNQDLFWMSRAVSGDELWVVGEGGLWHYGSDAWQGPISPPVLGSEMIRGLAPGPDGALWVAGVKTVAVLRDGTWSVAWTDTTPLQVVGLDVAPDGTVWVARANELVELRPESAGYTERSVACPETIGRISRIAAATDGTVYVGNFAYTGGKGLARSDGTTCTLVDPLGDGQVHEVAEITAGPAGSLLATLFDEGDGPYRVWVVMLRDGRWSTISGPTVEQGVSLGLALAPDGRPWAISTDDLVRYEDGAWDLVAAGAHSLAMAPDGVLWYQTDRGIERIRTNEFGE